MLMELVFQHLTKMEKKLNFDCDVILISVGRKPNTNNLNLDAIGVELDEKKRIINR